MFHSFRFVAAVLACLGVAVALLIPRGQVASADPKAPPESQAGRYQLFKSRNVNNRYEDCLLDTATGKVWRLGVDNEQQGAKWSLAVDGPR
jgi:hypothetical protein